MSFVDERVPASARVEHEQLPKRDGDLPGRPGRPVVECLNDGLL